MDKNLDVSKVILGDCLEVLKTMEDNSVDSVVTDPPYGISFMGKKWDYDVPSVEVWKESLRVLKPGGHILCACGTRTQHRMAVNLEDAGFEIRDIVAWVYGSGFPKSLNIGKAVDKLQGNEREVVGKQRGAGTTGNNTETGNQTFVAKNQYEDGTLDITKGNSPHEGWGTALKPAMELWTLARKPLEEKTVAGNVLKYGTGGINIDGCRVELAENDNDLARVNKTDNGIFGVGNNNNNAQQLKEKGLPPVGRFPANFIHDGSDEVVGLFPNTKSGAKKANQDTYNHKGKEFVATLGASVKEYEVNEGSASRFFYCAKASKSERNKGLDSSVSILIEYSIWNEKNTAQEVKKVQLQMAMDNLPQKVTGVFGTDSKNATEWNTMLFGNCTMEKFQEVNKSTTKTTTNSITISSIWKWLIHLLTNEYTVNVNYEMENGGNLVADVEKSNILITTINEKMASALGVNGVQSGTQLKISVKEGSNFHSTVKPVKLMQYLCRLITPKGGTVLDPFAGSGSSLIGAKQEGFNYIGIEKEPEYIEIINKRLQ